MDCVDARKVGACHPAPTPPAGVTRHEPLHRAFKAAEQAFRQRALHEMRAEGITDLYPGAAPLLLHLGDEDGLTMSELARRCGLESSTMTPLVDELERQGIVQRLRAAEDRRIIRLRLTAAGRDLEPRLRRLIVRLEDVAFTGIPECDISQLRATLEQIVCNLSAER